MLKFNKHLTNKLLRQYPPCVSNLFQGKGLRKFCEKKKLEEESINNQKNTTSEEDQMKNETKKNLYTYLRKLRRLIWTLIKLGFYTYSGLLLANYLMYKKYEIVEKNLGMLRIDHFQRVIYKMHGISQFFTEVKRKMFINRC